jgi:hypothetical protein
MFPAPISFLNNELKAELGMKTKKEEAEADDAKFSYMVKVKKYDSGTPEEFLKWRLTLNEQVKNNGYDANYDNFMNLAQAMLVGRSLEAFLNEKRSQEAKNRVRKAKTFLNWQSVLLTSKVDGEMPMRGRENTREEIFSWENSTQKSSVKDCRT